MGNYTQIFMSKGDSGQDDGTLYSLSDEYLEAAIVLRSSPPTRINCLSASYYLLGHSAELILKAFLYKQNESVSDLKKIGHNLEELITSSIRKGLPRNLPLDQIKEISNIYLSKGLEYRQRKKDTLPDIDLLIEEVRNLQAFVFSRCLRDQ